MKKIISLGFGLSLLGGLMIAAPAHAEDKGLDGNSVYAWLKSAGYVNESAPADIKPRTESGATTKPSSDQGDSAAVAQAKKTFPDFEQYPAYVQASLLNAQARGDFSAGSTGAAVQAINAGDWSQAATSYAALPGHSDADAQAFTRYAKDRGIEQTWDRAVAVGAASFGNVNVKATDAYTANHRLKELVATDTDNRQRFANNAGSTSFSFTVSSSTRGFFDISAPANQTFQFTVLDRNVQDGDIETIRLVNGTGTHINRTVSLLNAGTVITTRLQKGPNELRILARNQGSQGLNTGGVRIDSTVLTGPNDQDIALHTGETAVLRITGR